MADDKPWSARRATDIPRHGTSARYDRGCRCDACRADAARRVREWRHDIAGRTPPDTVHGTINGYNNWRCRCEPCKDARRAYNAARKLRQQ